jgi:hypothetical protein
MSKKERWQKCKHNNPSLYKENSVYCKLQQGYVSPQWCEFCPKYEEKKGEG